MHGVFVFAIRVAVAIIGAIGFGAAAHAQMLKQCVVGMHVIDESQKAGVITSMDGAFCYITFDDGEKASRMFYVLRPASAANTRLDGPLPDGEYDCAIGSGSFSHPNVVPMGRLDIKGSSYRFRPLGHASTGFAPYSVERNGSIHWSGHMGALDAPPSVLVRSTKTPQGFNVVYLVRPGADADTMSCHRI